MKDSVIKTEEEQRTIRQNNALHKWFFLLANELNAAGLDMRKVLKESIEIPWTKEMVKEHLWRPVQQAMLDKKSTTEMGTADPSKVYEVLNRHLAQKFGVHVPFPCWEILAEEQREERG